MAKKPGSFSTLGLDDDDDDAEEVDFPAGSAPDLGGVGEEGVKVDLLRRVILVQEGAEEETAVRLVPGRARGEVLRRVDETRLANMASVLSFVDLLVPVLV